MLLLSGHVHAGMAVFDTMRYIKSDVSTVCVGLAASMGAFILASGQKVCHSDVIQELYMRLLDMQQPDMQQGQCEHAMQLIRSLVLFIWLFRSKAKRLMFDSPH